jgi:hypothetical protein
MFLGIIGVLPLHILFYAACAKFEKWNEHTAALFVQLILYATVVIVRAPWIGDDPGGYLRYFMYPVFFLGCLALYVNIRRPKMYYGLALIGCIFMFKTAYLLAVPTTYNVVREFLIENVGDTPVVNEVGELDLPQSTISYRLTRTDLCQSKCQYALSVPVSGLLVVDDKTDMQRAGDTLRMATTSILVTTVQRADKEPLFEAGNGVSDGDFASMDRNLGVYSWNLLRMNRLGAPIFIYKSTGYTDVRVNN